MIIVLTVAITLIVLSAGYVVGYRDGRKAAYKHIVDNFVRNYIP